MAANRESVLFPQPGCGILTLWIPETLPKDRQGWAKDFLIWRVGGLAMGLVLKLVGLWVIASITLGPFFTWAFFRQRRIDRDIEEISSAMDSTHWHDQSGVCGR